MFCDVIQCVLLLSLIFFFFFNDTATTEIYTLSLHDALPISEHRVDVGVDEARQHRRPMGVDHGVRVVVEPAAEPNDRSVPDHQRVAVQERAPDVPAHELADVSNERLHTLRYALRRERSASRRANGPSNLICPFSMM